MTTVTPPPTPMWSVRPEPPTPHPPPTPLGPSLRRVGLVLVATAVLVDLAIQTRAGGLAAMLAVCGLCLGLARAGRVVRRSGRVLLAAASVVSVFLFLRASPWLLVMDLVTIVVLVSLACSAERDALPFVSRCSGFVRRLWATGGAVLTALPRATQALGTLLPKGSTGTRRVLWQVLRGLLLAGPILVVIGVFLAWADPVFASLFDLDLDLGLGPVFAHAAIAGAAIWIACGWFVQASRPPVRATAAPVSIGSIEGLVVMAGLTTLYGVFALSQLVVSRRGADYVVARTGLTYAEYARSGFFQLLWVAAVTVVVLVSLRSVVRLGSPRARRLFALLGAAAASLTLVIVHSAVVRLQLYDDVFGLTRLRYFSAAFAWWLAVVFVLVGVAMALTATRFGERDRLLFALGCSAVALVVVLNLVNPDRVIAQHNIERAADGAAFDADYAVTLSSDATPVLLEVLPSLDEPARAVLSAELCDQARSGEPVGWNLSLWRAASATAALCD